MGLNCDIILFRFNKILPMIVYYIYKIYKSESYVKMLGVGVDPSL